MFLFLFLAIFLPFSYSSIYLNIFLYTLDLSFFFHVANSFKVELTSHLHLILFYIIVTYMKLHKSKAYIGSCKVSWLKVQTLEAERPRLQTQRRKKKKKKTSVAHLVPILK